jgi:hypothetical protein
MQTSRAFRKQREITGKISSDVQASTVERKTHFGPTVMSDQHFGALRRLDMSNKSPNCHGGTPQFA